MTAYAALQPLDLATVEATLPALLRQIASNAAAIDASAQYPEQNIQLLRQAGLLRATLPEELGGLGWGRPRSYSRYIRFLSQLSAACSNTAQVYSVHANAIISIQDLGGQAQLRRYLQAIEDGQLFCFVGSEPTDRFDRAGKRVAFSSTALRVADGWQIQARKSFATGSVGASWALLHCSAEELPAPDNWLLAAVDLAAPEVNVIDDWNNMGQRATSSGTLAVEGHFVADADIVGGPGAIPRARHLGCLYQLTFVALLVGIAEGAYAFTKEYLVSQRRPTHGYDKVGEEPSVQLRAADMSVAIAASRALLDHATALFDAWDGQVEGHVEDIHELLAAVYRARVHISQTSVSVTNDLFVLTGARSTTGAVNADRFWRNARTLSLHDNIDKQRGIIGRYELGIEMPIPGVR